jgi:integrase
MSRPPRPPRLEQNEHGIYEIRWRKDGKARSLSTGTKIPQEAGAFLATWTEEAKRAANPAGIRICDILDNYWSAWAHDTISAETTKSHIKLLKEALGFYEVGALTPADVETYKRKRRRGLTGNRPVGDGTLRRELAILTAAINHAVGCRMIRRDDAPTIAMPPQPQPRDRYLGLDEMDRLLDASRSMRDGDRLSRLERFLALAFHTGARKEAIVKLGWDRIDLGNRLIDFRDRDLRTTRKRRATVPISDALLPVLRQAWDERKGALVLDTTGPIRSVFERCVERAGLEDVTPHTLRHTWATHASMNGVALGEIARVLGNTVAVCEKVYAKFQPGYLRAAVNSAYGGRRFDLEERAP